jgi:hypothetical protein
LAVEEISAGRAKLVSQDSLWKIMGYYLTEEHRLFVEHVFRNKENSDMYDLEKVVAWMGTQQEEDDEKGWEVAASTVEKIEERGGVQNVLREYQQAVLMAEQADSQQQR